MSKLPIVIATLALGMGAARAIEVPDVRATAGLPQVARVDGRAAAWRNVALRAETPLVGLSATLPTCLEGSRAPAARSAAHPGPVPTGCASSAADGARALPGQQIEARFSLPSRGTARPNVDVTLRHWRGTGRTARGADAATRPGSEAEIELTQSIGNARAFAGYSLPIGGKVTGENWRTAYAGASWKPAERQSVEVSYDASRQPQTRERDRQLTLTYAHARAQNLRLKAELTRKLDDRSNRVESTLGLEWTF